MKVEIIKNKNGESIYPLGHAEATMYDEEKTVKDAVPFRFGIVEGQYGYFERGADTFHPFSSGGSSKPTYLVTNSGSGLFVTDLNTFEETKLNASEINTYHVSDAFKLDWNVLHRNCYTVVATGNVTVNWRRAGQYTYQSVDLTDGGEQFIFAASEYGYAIVVCN